MTVISDAIRLVVALESIAEDRRPEHTCDHSDYAQRTLEEIAASQKLEKK